MVEVSKLWELIESKDKQLDKDNGVDEKTLLFRLKTLDKQYQNKIEATFQKISKQWTTKQAEDFKKRAGEVYERHSQRLWEIQTKLLQLWENETRAYEQVMKQFEDYVNKLNDDVRNVNEKWLTTEELKWIERIKYVEDVMYNNLWIDRNTYNNGWWWQFVKWVLDEVVLWNVELVNAIYENWMDVVSEMIKQLLSWEWLKEIAHQLWISVGDLFVWNSYERWRSFWQLWLVFTGWWLAFSGGKKIFNIVKDVSKNVSKEWLVKWTAKVTAWVIVSAWELAESVRKLPEYARKTLDWVLAHIGKKESILAFGRIVEWWDLRMINKFIKAFQVNDKILWSEQYAYMSSGATYMLLRNFNVLPWDLDVAVNPKNMKQFVDKILTEAKTNKSMEEPKFIELQWEWKVRKLDINNPDEIRKVAQDWKLAISYKIEWLEVELFPEIDWKWLTNLWYMDKWVVKHKVEKDGKTIVEVPSLDNKWAAQWYVLNYLDEFWNSSVDWIEWKLRDWVSLSKVKMKDANRVNNIYMLLKDAWLIDNPEQLIKFLDDTVKEYDKLPNKWSYVEWAIDKANVVRWKKQLKDMILNFYTELNKKFDQWKINWVSQLPSFKEFSDQLSDKKMEAFWLYKQYLDKWGELNKSILEIKLRKIEDTVRNAYDKISVIDDFAYYYEYRTTVKFVETIRQETWIKISK